jgi:hypothetical protein
MGSSHTSTPSKHEKEDDESSVDLTIYDTMDDKRPLLTLKCLTQRILNPLMIVVTALKR